MKNNIPCTHGILFFRVLPLVHNHGSLSFEFLYKDIRYRCLLIIAPLSTAELEQEQKDDGYRQPPTKTRRIM